MHYLGTMTNHHLSISDSEQNAIVNSLAFFNAVFDPRRNVKLVELIADWQETANDTDLQQVDDLATRIATLNNGKY